MDAFLEPIAEIATPHTLGFCKEPNYAMPGGWTHHLQNLKSLIITLNKHSGNDPEDRMERRIARDQLNSILRGRDKAGIPKLLTIIVPSCFSELDICIQVPREIPRPYRSGYTR